MSDNAFYPLEFVASLPRIFPSPFDVRPHEVAVQAARSLKDRLTEYYPDARLFEQPSGGKMFGVLVVRNTDGATGYLSGFSGMLQQSWEQSGFVSPVFDQIERRALQADGESQVADLSRRINHACADKIYLDLTTQLQHAEKNANVQIDQAKSHSLERKAARRVKRVSANAEELEALADESRRDKYEFRELKRELTDGIESIYARLKPYQENIDSLKKARKQQSNKLQRKLFEGYKLRSADSKTAVMTDFFVEGLPPSGAGDCAAVKLLQYAHSRNLVPIALAEFWWGAAPVGGLREHGRYYPACRSRCRKVLPYMLNGIPCSVPLHEQPVNFSADYPHTLYEDDDIVVVEKPAGLLSVPGKVLTDSVEERLKLRYPEVSGVMLLHRLDQATSGVMIAAKNASAYKNLQHQFQDRVIEKRYIAVLDGILEPDHGQIELPLRIDIYDRPRQIVCFDRGKSALTRFKVLSRDGSTTRIAFFPHTGRTHQLRVHAAHSKGLNCPIYGDELYGRPLDRLKLHAEKITFNHPHSGVRMSYRSEVPF